MLIGSNSKYLLKQTRSKAKMYEYSVPIELHIAVEDNSNELLLTAIAAIGNISAEVLNHNKPYRIIPKDKKEELEFASHYFDAFLQSKLNPSIPNTICFWDQLHTIYVTTLAVQKLWQI